jgi:hypothetical protein
MRRERALHHPQQHDFEVRRMSTATSPVDPPIAYVFYGKRYLKSIADGPDGRLSSQAPAMSKIKPGDVICQSINESEITTAINPSVSGPRSTVHSRIGSALLQQFTNCIPIVPAPFRVDSRRSSWVSSSSHRDHRRSRDATAEFGVLRCAVIAQLLRPTRHDHRYKSRYLRQSAPPLA